MARVVGRHAKRGRAPSVSLASETISRFAYAMRVLHLIPCNHPQAYVAGPRHVCEDCGATWTVQLIRRRRA